MSKLTSRVERLEDGDDRYCTLGDIMDAIEAADCGEAMRTLRPVDPRLTEFFGKIEGGREPGFPVFAS